MNFCAQYFFVLIHLCRIFFSKLLNCIGIKAKVSAVQQHNSNACVLGYTMHQSILWQEHIYDA